MARIRIFGAHRTWEDWATVSLGVMIMLSPLPSQPSDLGCPTMTDVAWNAIFIGFAVSALGAIELIDLHRWEQIGEIICGAWLIASPFIFGYAGSGLLQHWHFGLGAAVLLLAVIELWQDWNRNGRQPAHLAT